MKQIGEDPYGWEQWKSVSLRPCKVSTNKCFGASQAAKWNVCSSRCHIQLYASNTRECSFIDCYFQKVSSHCLEVRCYRHGWNYKQASSKKNKEFWIIEELKSCFCNNIICKRNCFSLQYISDENCSKYMENVFK